MLSRNRSLRIIIKKKTFIISIFKTFQSFRCCDQVLPEAWQWRGLHKEVLESEALKTREITALLMSLLLRSLD